MSSPSFRRALHVDCPPGFMPRAALGALVAPLFVTLYRMGLLPEAHALLVRAQQQLAHRRDRCRPEVAGVANPARELARKIDRTIPLIYGGGALGAVAAMRWKCDVNENAKAPAFWAAHPELDHNEICGFGQHGDVTRQVFTLVELRHGFEHERLAPRFEFTRGLRRGVRRAGARGAGRRGGSARAAARPHVRRRLDELLPRARRTTWTPAPSTPINALKEALPVKDASEPRSCRVTAASEVPSFSIEGTARRVGQAVGLRDPLDPPRTTRTSARSSTSRRGSASRSRCTTPRRSRGSSSPAGRR